MPSLGERTLNMKGPRFDALARTATRRGALRALAGGVAAAVALRGRQASADVPLGYSSLAYDYDPVTFDGFTAYYRPALLDGPGRYCFADAAIVGRVATFRAECTDNEYQRAESIPTLYGAVTIEGDDNVERFVATCRKRPKKYRDRMVMRCSISF